MSEPTTAVEVQAETAPDILTIALVAVLIGAGLALAF